MSSHHRCIFRPRARHPHWQNLLILIILSCLTACTSLAPSSDQTTRHAQSKTSSTRDIAQDWQAGIAKRNLYLPGIQWQHELTQLTGSVLVQYREAVDGKFWALGKRIDTPGVALLRPPLERPLQLAGFVDQHSDASLQAFAAGTPKLKAGQLAYFDYTDLYAIRLNTQELNKLALAEEANLKEENIAAKFYIQGVTLGVLQRRRFAPGADGEGLVADLSGRRYQATSPASSELVVSLDLMPMSAYATPPREAENQAIKAEGLRIEL